MKKLSLFMLSIIFICSFFLTGCFYTDNSEDEYNRGYVDGHSEGYAEGSSEGEERFDVLYDEIDNLEEDCSELFRQSFYSVYDGLELKSNEICEFGNFDIKLYSEEVDSENYNLHYEIKLHNESLDKYLVNLNGYYFFQMTFRLNYTSEEKTITVDFM